MLGPRGEGAGEALVACPALVVGGFADAAEHRCQLGGAVVALLDAAAGSVDPCAVGEVAVEHGTERRPLACRSAVGLRDWRLEPEREPRCQFRPLSPVAGQRQLGAAVAAHQGDRVAHRGEVGPGVVFEESVQLAGEGSEPGLEAGCQHGRLFGAWGVPVDHELGRFGEQIGRVGGFVLLEGLECSFCRSSPCDQSRIGHCIDTGEGLDQRVRVPRCLIARDGGCRETGRKRGRAASCDDGPGDEQTGGSESLREGVAQVAQHLGVGGSDQVVEAGPGGGDQDSVEGGAVRAEDGLGEQSEPNVDAQGAEPFWHVASGHRQQRFGHPRQL